MGEKVWCRREKMFYRFIRVIWDFLCTWGAKYGGGIALIVCAFALPSVLSDIEMNVETAVMAWLLYGCVALFAYLALLMIGEGLETMGKYRSAIAVIIVFGLLAGYHLTLLSTLCPIWVSLLLAIPVVLIMIGSILHEMCEIEKVKEKADESKYEQKSTA